MTSPTDADTGSAGTTGQHEETEMRTHPFDLLRAHVPLALLLDLASADGPDSARILREEPADTGWLQLLQEHAAAVPTV
jgi:hypothetical protein